MCHWSIEFPRWATVFNWPNAGEHPSAILRDCFYLAKINLFISINYLVLFHIPRKFMKNMSCFEIFLPRLAFSNILQVVIKKLIVAKRWQPLVNNSWISQFQKNVISFNFLANTLTPHKGRIATTVPGITGQADDTDLKRWCILTTIASYQADYIIFSDGSSSRGTRSRGAAAIDTRGSLLQSEVVNTIKTKRRTFISSYKEEEAAMKSALSWTSTTPGNDLAAKAAKEATTIATNTILPDFFSSSIQVVNETIRDDLPTHECVALI